MRACVILGALILLPLGAIDDYVLGPDSTPRSDVPRSTITEFEHSNSTVYPGTWRKWWISVPGVPAPEGGYALMVFQDGEGWVKTNGQIRATVVMDNLMARGEIPPMVGVFVNPGRKIPVDMKKKPENRGFEYDSLTNLYATFLLDEILPRAAKIAPISEDPEMRGLAGSSSGGICAFTACWERPDRFRKVVSFVGSFVDLRGGHAYPSLLRKTRPVKPIRVFLQDGTNDLDNSYGNWPLANLQMAAALKFSGYEHRLEMGDGAHNSKHGASILPEMMRWVWSSPKTSTPRPFEKAP